ncbi:type II toxin-antitoxin system VapB family antitoxin [candidate division CSSED10-310 bacterium]|uniref:Type II toxin-antitoxin system VapB family antitoxin n=1 Tax=candidate division CSSED10-310 bacterium TaxID=2855610 RepID=A0ABV6YSZ9_UNCC1
MRTTLNIADGLLEELMVLSGISNKTKVIEMALNDCIRKLKRQKIKASFGQIQFDLDIQEFREQEKNE